MSPDDERLRWPETTHGLLVRATLPRLAPRAVVSHVSAAVLHGLPIWHIPLKLVHVTRNGGSGGRISGRLHLHVASLGERDIVDVDGVAVTSVARTIVDLARSEPFEQAVVIADAALHSRLVVPSELTVALERSARWRGAPQARRAVEFSDGLAESPGESRSRVAIRRAGLPRPTLQWAVRTADGRVLGWTDFGWPELRAVGEFDGRVKYGRLLKPGQSAADVVHAEKVREDDIRAEGLSMVRWGWADLDDFTPTAARLRRAFGLA